MKTYRLIVLALLSQLLAGCSSGSKAPPTKRQPLLPPKARYIYIGHKTARLTS